MEFVNYPLAGLFAVVVVVVPWCFTFYGLMVSRQSLNSANEKLRLELYNRRFAIYSAILDYYQATFNDPENAQLLQVGVTKFVNESQFLFAPEDQVFDLLKRINELLIKFNILQRNRRVPGNQATLVTLERTYGMAADEASDLLPELEKRMLPYLDFRANQRMTRRNHGKLKSMFGVDWSRLIPIKG